MIPVGEAKSAVDSQTKARGMIRFYRICPTTTLVQTSRPIPKIPYRSEVGLVHYSLNFTFNSLIYTSPPVTTTRRSLPLQNLFIIRECVTTPPLMATVGVAASIVLLDVRQSATRVPHCWWWLFRTCRDQ